MYAVSLQLSGSLLLAWMVITRTRDDIIISQKSFVRIANRVPEGLRRVILETWLAKIGFALMSTGYAVQAFSNDTAIQGLLYRYNPLNRLLELSQPTCLALNTAGLALLGLYMAIAITKRQHREYTAADFDKITVSGELMFDETSSA